MSIRALIGGLRAFGPVAAVLLLSAPAFSQMSLPGKFDVSEQGSATYTVPISIPPGSAGLQPKLDLVYDSRGGNGLLGVGWSLAGLPAITRCGRTLVQDGAVGGVAFDANDRFCLDGQRLVATTGTYGADGTVYGTERESFSKVVSYGSAGSGPAWFKVWTKAGLILEFGNTADSRIEAVGKSSARVWALNKTSDTKGNYFSVSYTEDTTNGEYRPSRIDYTGNASAGVSPYASVRFVYETRTDIVPLYQVGSLIKTTQRLTKVQVWQTGDMVREYRMAYEQSPSTQRSRITSLQLCDGAGACLSSTTLSWSNTDFSFPQPQRWISYFDIASAAGHWTNENARPRKFGDVNGDGLPDIAGFDYDGTYVAPSNSTSFVAPQTRWTDQFGYNQANGWWTNESVYPRHLVDVNGDGKADIIGFYYDGVHVSLSTGSGFSAPTMWIAAYGAMISQGQWNDESLYRRMLIDMNGDGLADIAGFGKEGIYVSLNTGTSFATSVLWIAHFGSLASAGSWNSEYYYPRYFADVNGDGLPDVVGLFSDGAYVAISTGSGFLTQTRWIDQFGSGGPAGGWYGSVYSRQLVDMNGDGLADIVGYYINGIYVSLSDGTQFLPPTYWINYFGAAVSAGQWTNDNVWPRRIADMNGDGLPDMIGFNSDGMYVALSDGTKFLTQTRWLNHFGAAWEAGQYNNDSLLPRFLLDLNGDGLIDVGGYEGNGPKASAPTKTIPDLLLTVTTGSGASTQISYKPLSGVGAPYTRDTGGSACSYPCVDIQGPLYVVSEVKTSNGVGGEYRSTYRYVGAKAHAQGRGFLGFRQLVARDEQTGIEQTSTYLQDYPYTGLLATREKKRAATAGAAGPQLNLSTNSYAADTLSVANGGGQRRFVKLTQSVEQSWELPASGTSNGTTMPSVTTGYTYDAYGNATEVSVGTGDGHSKTTTNTYTNDVTNWFLGRLTRAVVTSTTP